MITRQQFDEDEKVTFLTFREQYAVIVAIETVLGVTRHDRPMLPEMRERLKGVLEKLKPEVDEAFKELGK